MEAIDNFYTAVKPFLNTWTNVELRAIGDLRSGSLMSMVASLTSQPEPPNETETLEDIAFIKTSVPAELLKDLLEKWKLGWFEIDDKKFSTANEFTEPTFQSYGPVAFGDLRYCWPNLEKYLGWTLLSYGKRNFEMMVQPRDFWSLARSRNFTSTDEKKGIFANMIASIVRLLSFKV